MIKVVANQRLDLSKEEYEYYLELEKSFGKEAFLGLFKTNDKGHIISVIPSSSQPTALVLIFFLLNVMNNQRLRGMDRWLRDMDKLEARIVKLEKQQREK